MTTYRATFTNSRGDRITVSFSAPRFAAAAGFSTVAFRDAARAAFDRYAESTPWIATDGSWDLTRINN